MRLVNLVALICFLAKAEIIKTLKMELITIV